MLIGDLFERDVTRAIPPVVYFHEQDPAALEREVSEYIITGGYPKGDARATDEGIHEQLVKLLDAIRGELTSTDGASNPACWISGFYGSGKSSFAKLLGLALDGKRLPSGKTLAEALLAQDRSPDAPALAKAWHLLTGGIQPIAVVFDVGSKAREAEQVHAVIVRQVQLRLGYSSSNLVAEHELKLEIEKLYPAFLEKVREVHGKPWTQLKDSPLAEDYFSAALAKLQPDLYEHPMAWVDARSGSRFEGHDKKSADEAVEAIERMLAERMPGRTIFLVVDEVSQYVHNDDHRMLALQSFVSALGQRMKGKGWLLATGQQKLEEGTGVATAIVKMKDRFPPSLRVHLGIANIRDVVHRRLLAKDPLQQSDLEALCRKHRPDLALYAYKGDEISDTDFAEMYPLLPGHVRLLLDITTGLRSRSQRTQGDAHAIRGLLQLLGDLFREHDLARREVGYLVTIDRVYDVLHSALDADVQMTISSALDLAKKHGSALMARVVKAVAMLELVHNGRTTAELVARCLYEKLGDGNLEPDVQRALDVLTGENLLGYSDKSGYKIESSAGQEWQHERDAISSTAEQESEKVRAALRLLIADIPNAQLQGVALPWLVLYSDDWGAKDVHVKDEKKATVVTVDFRFTRGEGREQWVPRSGTDAFKDRIVWVFGDVDGVRLAAGRVVKSEKMIAKYAGRESTLGDDKKHLLIEERNRLATASRELAEAVKAGLMAGKIYFRERGRDPREVEPTFVSALATLGNRAAIALYPNPVTFTATEKDIAYLIDNAELSAPPPVFGEDKLGILTLDAGRYEPTCTGRVPTDILTYVKEQGGVTGSTLLSRFGGPPYGVPPDVLRAAVVGLLRGARIRIEIPGTGEISSVRDQGARELLKDTGLKRATITENTKEVLLPRDRNAIGALFKDLLGKDVARDNDAIADAVHDRFADVRRRVTDVAERFRRLPRETRYPEALEQLEVALESCRRNRNTEPTVKAVKSSLGALRDGLTLLRRMETDLTEAACKDVSDAHAVLAHLWPALAASSPSEDARAAAAYLERHLKAERPWENSAELRAKVVLLRDEHRSKRRAILDAHAKAVDLAIESLKRRAGFERLDPDQRHDVLRHLQTGGEAGTDEDAIAPPLDALDGILLHKRQTAEHKALAQLDALLESVSGARPVIEVSLGLAGREIETETELARLLDEIEARIVHELAAKHRVRLRGS